MPTKTPNRSTQILLVTVLVLLIVLAVVTALSWPYLFPDPASLEVPPAAAPTQAPTEQITEPPTELPTEPEPTLPPPEPNPYGPLDFQYEGKFLKLIQGECRVGVDVSSWQYDVDWDQVKAAGVDFAMIRVARRGYTEGTISDDKYARSNLSNALAAGLDVGVYFFSQALTPEEAEEEAYYVLDFIQDYEITMPVVFDWEHVEDENARTKDMDRRTLTDCARAFLETVEAAGYWPMLYFNTTQSRTLLNLSELKEYDFWLAAYTDRMRFPYKIKMWQYTCEATVPGICVPCDLNVFFLDP